MKKTIQNKNVKLMRETQALLTKLVQSRAGGISESKLVTLALVEYARTIATTSESFELRKELFELVYDCELYLKHEYTLDLDQLTKSGGIAIEQPTELDKVKIRLVYPE